MYLSLKFNDNLNSSNNSQKPDMFWAQDAKILVGASLI